MVVEEEAAAALAARTNGVTVLESVERDGNRAPGGTQDKPDDDSVDAADYL
jgi:hypothetical protein